MSCNDNHIFGPTNKNIKLSKDGFKVMNGSNTLSVLSLCNFNYAYNQYNRLSLIIPANTIDYELKLPIINPTLLILNVQYKGNKINQHYLKYKFVDSLDQKRVMTNLLVLTGTNNNPISNLLIDNLSQTCPVHLEILIATNTQTYNDETSLFYANNLSMQNISAIDTVITINDFTINVEDVIGVEKHNDKIIINTNTYPVILEFINLYEQVQSHSALLWYLSDTDNHILPTSYDNTGPVITFNNIINNELEIELNDYSGTYTRLNFIDNIDSIIDNRDGVISVDVSMISFIDNNLPQLTFDSTGVYTVVVTVTDNANNTTIETIELTII